MSHSYKRIWIHAVWTTKERLPLIHQKVEKEIHEYIYREFNELGCPVRIINGMPDHIHCLFLLNPQISLADIIKQIKGSTSHLINQNEIIPGKFAWQKGYAAFSVSESIVDTVYYYILGQKAHHAKNTVIHEYESSEDSVIK